MKKILLLAILSILAALPYKGHCTILHVPAAYSSIQEAIDASSDGDMVLVEPGTYYENLYMSGKNIVLCSNYFTTGNSAFITNTIIDGSDAGRVITIDLWENESCQVVGFTIQHGNSPSDPYTTYGGGGIFINNTSPQILHCIIQNNYAPGYGGGLCIYGSNSNARVMNCTIQNNTADSFGGGVFMGDCSPVAEIVNCIISGNINTNTDDYSGGGGGVNLYHTGKLTNCLVTSNSAPNSPVGGGGVHCDWGDDVSPSILITGCTITNNTALNWGGVSYVIYGGEFRNCIIWGNTDNYENTSNYDGNAYVNCCSDPLPDGTGNISEDPGFVNPASGNFRLSAGSPCINAGDYIYNTQFTDLDGNPRIYDYSIDMGAYEYGSTADITVQIGSGTDISGELPIYSCYNYTYSQQIYLGSEIAWGGGSAGIISKIRFFYSGGGSQFSNWNTWTVYLGNTAKTEFAGIWDWVPVASMKQVFSGTIPVPVDGSWLEISLTSPFYYSGDNIVIAVNEDTQGYDCNAQWGSFYSGAPRGLSFFDYDNHPDPAFPADATMDPAYSIPQIQFDINPGVGTLEGYVTEEPGCVVPIEGATIITGAYSTTSDAAGFYQLFLPVGSYSITAIYNDANQTISPVDIYPNYTTYQDFCLTPYYAPPVDLQALVNGPDQDNVHLTWLAPGSVADQYIHWDNGSMYGSLGYGAPMTFSVASRWPVPDIEPYGGTYLKKIRFVVADVNAAYTLKVWEGSNASAVLLSQVVTDPIIGGWNEVTLTTPILIDGTKELWFGYEIVQTVDGYPAGLGSGPAVVRKGDMINSGYGWFSMKEAWGWEFNWTIQGFVSESAVPLAPQHLIPMVQNTQEQTVVTNPMSSSEKPQVILLGQTPNTKPSSNFNMMDHLASKPAIMAPHAPSATLTGYNVYRDGFIIAENIPDLYYDDPALPKGSYYYQVSALYDFGESDRIGPVYADIYTCFPPTSLTVSNATLTTTTADLSWTPSTVSMNPEWTLEWGPSGFTPGDGTIVHITSIPEYSLSDLTLGTEYDVYVNTYCSSTDASAWVKKTFRTHYFNCPDNAIAEIEACGNATNNGCEQEIPGWENINCGDTICGASWLSRSHRDPDWYSFTLSGPNEVTISGDAEFSKFFGIASSPCPSSLINTSIGSGAGYPIEFTTLLGAAGTYYIYVVPAYAEQVVCDSLNRYWFTIKCNSCLSPTALNATIISSTSADLTWTSNAANWNVEWGPFGFSQGTGTLISGTTANPYHLSGLTMGYAYSYYVQSDCGAGSTSNWAGPYTFFLTCPSTNLPYAEDFTTQIIGNTPQCWQAYGAGAPSNWIVDANNYAGGAPPQLMFFPYNPYFDGRSYLISPVINTMGQTTLDLSFKQYINAYSSGSSCEIWTTSDGGNTWNAVWSVSQAGQVGPETIYMTLTTSDVGSATFQFAFAVNGYSWNIGTWHIDDITLIGNGPPANRTVQNETVINGQTTCYDATQTITVAGSGTTFLVENGGIVTMIAGINIDYLPGTWVKPGGYMLGKIAPSGPYCGGKAASMVNAVAPEEKNPPAFEKPYFKVYPNPTTGKFRLELAGNLQSELIRIEIYGMRGEKMLSEALLGETVHEISVSGIPDGIYIVKVVAGETVFTSKLVKRR